MKPDKLPALSEKDFARQIEDLLRLRNWKFYHVFESNQYARRTSKGFPDYICLRESRCLVIELKSEKGKLTNEQAAWLSSFAMTKGVETYVWRPSMWPIIMEVLE